MPIISQVSFGGELSGVKPEGTTNSITGITHSSIKIVTVDVDAGQIPFEMDQIKSLIPELNPETEVFSKVESVKIPDPDEIVQKPDPIIGVFPLNTIELIVSQIVVSFPASAIVGNASIEMTTVDAGPVHPFSVSVT